MWIYCLKVFCFTPFTPPPPPTFFKHWHALLASCYSNKFPCKEGVHRVWLIFYERRKRQEQQTENGCIRSFSWESTQAIYYTNHTRSNSHVQVLYLKLGHVSALVLPEDSALAPKHVADLYITLICEYYSAFSWWNKFTLLIKTVQGVNNFRVTVLKSISVRPAFALPSSCLIQWFV
jgi:hypothetical protein